MFGYMLHDKNDAVLVAKLKHSSDPYPYKVIRYGLVFDGFYTKQEALDEAYRIANGFETCRNCFGKGFGEYLPPNYNNYRRFWTCEKCKGNGHV